MKLLLMKLLLIILLLIIIYNIYNTYNTYNTIFGFADKNDPYIYPQILHNFITKEDAVYIINKAKNNLIKSSTVDNKNDPNRTNSQYWLSKHDPVAKKLIEKIDLPFENAEDIQVANYKQGQFYRAHHDSCCENTENCKKFSKKSGQRIRTILIRLNDNFTGGGTEFPELNKIYKPSKYDALMFYPLAKNINKCHPYALHSGMDVTSGEKWIANIWFYEREFST